MKQEEKDTAVAAANKELTRADKLHRELQVHAYPFTHIPLPLVPVHRALCDQGHSSAHVGYCSLIDDGSVIAH